MEEQENIIKNYEEYEDPELLMLISEKNDDAKDIIYEKYQYIIGIVLKKYKKAFNIKEKTFYLKESIKNRDISS